MQQLDKQMTLELSNNNKEVDVDKMNADEALSMALHIQEKDLGILDDALDDVNDSKQMGATINMQLDQQIESLDHAIETVDKIDSNLDIANKELNQIASRLARDKMIMVLVCVCVAVIILCSVLYILFG